MAEQMRIRARMALAIAIAMLIVSFVALYTLPVPNKPFRASVWKSLRYGQTTSFSRPLYYMQGDTQRIEMLKDLRRNHLRLGMKRQAIVQNILGSADMVDGTGGQGPIDNYNLVDPPASFQWWQVTLWLRYRASAPTLALEYGGKDSHLINISVS